VELLYLAKPSRDNFLEACYSSGAFAINKSPPKSGLLKASNSSGTSTIKV